jgi:23S rRNA pseudouridine955/2504/2580 synthase
MRELEVTSLQAGQRLDRLLGKYLKEASGPFLHKMLRKKNITLNGRRADGSEKVAEGDLIRIFFAEETLEKFTGSGPKGEAGKKDLLERYPSTVLDILYEDENILLVNKPAGMLTQKASDEDISLNEYAIGYLLRSGALSEEDLLSFRPSVCNRLDRNTSGIVAVGKSVAGLQELSKMFHDRTVHKYYRTIVLGHIEKSRTIEGYLKKDQDENRVLILKEPAPEAQLIRTGYTPLGWASDGNPGHDLTMLEIELITGRSHQIRAHLSSAGHAVAGDPKYGSPKRNDYFRREYQVRRQLLHADHITFPAGDGCLGHLSGRTFTAPLPDDFQRVVKGEKIRERKDLSPGYSVGETE